jgi:hypothetical protein
MKGLFIALIAGLPLGLGACASTGQFFSDTANGAANSAKSATQDSVNQKTSTATQKALGNGN